MIDEFERMWNESVTEYLTHYPSICLLGRVETIKKLVRIDGLRAENRIRDQNW